MKRFKYIFGLFTILLITVLGLSIGYAFGDFLYHLNTFPSAKDWVESYVLCTIAGLFIGLRGGFALYNLIEIE